VNARAAGACLVAGCGDVGSRVAARLSARGERVYGLRRTDAALPPGVVALRADLTDRSTLARLPDDIDRVVFLPAPGSADQAAYRGLFLDGVANLLATLPRVGELVRFVFVSSSAVYGEHDGAWVDEDTPSTPLAFNGEILLEAERRLAERTIPLVVARCSGLYGPGRTRVIDRVVDGTARVAAGAPAYSNRVHVDDAAAALVHLLDAPDAIPRCIVSDDAPVPLGQVSCWIAGQLGLPAPPVGPPLKDRAVGNKRLSNRRLRESGFTFAFPDYQAGYGPMLASLRRGKP
jgi:nucleoside-diphosphate-sugar epimerase